MCCSNMDENSEYQFEYSMPLSYLLTHMHTHTCYYSPPPQFTDELKAQIVQMLNALNPEIDNATYVAAADGIVQLETNLSMVSH